MRPPLLALLTLLGCASTNGTLPLGDRPQPPDPVEDTAPPLITEEEIADQEIDDSWLFSDEHIVEVEITLTAGAAKALGREPREDVSAELVIDGLALEPVGLRLAGKLGSFRELSGKPKFRIDFNKFSEGQRFFGLESLALNNGVQDCSFLKEPAAYKIYREAGAPGSRTGFAHVTVNGADYGLYIIVEYPDDRFLKRNFTEPGGNLYDGKYVLYDDWSYTLLDLYDDYVPLYALEEGEDVQRADIQAVVDAIDEHEGAPTFYEALGEVVDWPSFHRHIALEQLVGHNDGYALNINNNRLYFDPAQQGRMTMLTWDLDNSFLVDSEWGFSWSSPGARLVYWCWQDSTCKAAQREAVIAVLDATDIPALLDWYDATAAVTVDAAQSDPRKEFDNTYLASCRSDARQRINRSKRLVMSHWGIE